MLEYALLHKVKECEIRWIESVSEDPIDPENPFLNVLMRHQVGETVVLNVNRFGRDLALGVTLRERPY